MGFLNRFESVGLFIFHLIILEFDGGLGVFTFLMEIPPFFLKSFHLVFTLFMLFSFSSNFSLGCFESVVKAFYFLPLGEFSSPRSSQFELKTLLSGS